MRIDSDYLIRHGWHFVRLKTTNEKRWCHGGTFESYTYHQARKIQADRDEKRVSRIKQEIARAILVKCGCPDCYALHAGECANKASAGIGGGALPYWKNIATDGVK